MGKDRLSKLDEKWGHSVIVNVESSQAQMMMILLDCTHSSHFYIDFDKHVTSLVLGEIEECLHSRVSQIFRQSSILDIRCTVGY